MLYSKLYNDFTTSRTHLNLSLIVCPYFLCLSKQLLLTILLNIIFHALMGRFQLELIYCFTYFSPPSLPTLVCYFPVGLQEKEETSTPTRTVENVVLTTKGLQKRITQMLDGTTEKNRQNDKLILSSVKSHFFHNSTNSIHPSSLW